jgi:hypothetical protein
MEEVHARHSLELENIEARYQEELQVLEENNKAFEEEIEFLKSQNDRSFQLENEWKTEDLEQKLRVLQKQLFKMREDHENILTKKNEELRETIEKFKKEKQEEIEKIKSESKYNISCLVSEEYSELLKSNSTQISQLTKENERIKKELWRDKNYEEVKKLHTQLDGLKKQSFEELISFKKERDDMANKVKHLEHQLQKGSYKQTGRRQLSSGRGRNKTQSQLCQTSWDRNSCDKAEELRDEIDNLNAVINQYKTQIKATEAGERRLKEQLLNKDSSFEEERKEMRALLAAEKRQVIKAQEDSLKIKEEFQKKKNSILREIMEKDEIIHKLSLQIHEIK